MGQSEIKKVFGFVLHVSMKEMNASGQRNHPKALRLVAQVRDKENLSMECRNMLQGQSARRMFGRIRILSLSKKGYRTPPKLDPELFLPNNGYALQS